MQDLPLPQNGGSGFEDVDISADGKLALLTGSNSSSSNLLVLIRAPFTAAGATSQTIPIQNVQNPGRGIGSVRFQPAGLAPGLTISKSAPASVASGANLTYTISYANTGAANASGVVIRDPLPSGTTFVSATNNGALMNGSVTFNVGNLPANSGNRSVSFTVRVTAAAGATVNNNGYTIEGTGVAPIPGPPITTTVTAGGGGNRAPVAQNQSVTTPQGTPINITLRATDADNDPLAYGIVRQPSRGTLTVVSPNTVRYTPAAGFSGADNFTFQASDGQALSNIATVSINVTPNGGGVVNRVTGSGVLRGGNRNNGLLLKVALNVSGDANGNGKGSITVSDGTRNGVIRSTRIDRFSVEGDTATITGLASYQGRSYRFSLFVSDTRTNNGTFDVRINNNLFFGSRVKSGSLLITSTGGGGGGQS